MSSQFKETIITGRPPFKLYSIANDEEEPYMALDENGSYLDKEEVFQELARLTNILVEIAQRFCGHQSPKPSELDYPVGGK